MKYTHQNRFKKSVSSDLEKKARFVAKVGICYSIAIVLIGVALSIIFNVNRYDGVIGEPMYVDVAIYDAKEVVVEEEQGGATVVRSVWKPVGNFTYQGYSCDVYLGDGYSAEEFARQDIGRITNICVDTATLEEVNIKPFNYIGIAVAVVGAMMILIFTCVWVYFSNWNESYSIQKNGECRIYG